MSASAIFDALLIAGDALQDGRLDDAEGVLAGVDEMGAWDFELVDYSRKKLRRMLDGMSAAVTIRLLDPESEYEPPDPMTDVESGLSKVRHAHRYACRVNAPDEIKARLVRWMQDAQRILGIPTGVASLSAIYKQHYPASALTALQTNVSPWIEFIAASRVRDGAA